MSDVQHYDGNGKPCSLYALCRDDPGWAESRIRCERAELDSLRAELDEVKAELLDRCIVHEVSVSMSRAYLGMLSSTLHELQQPNVDQDAEPPEVPEIAKQVRRQRDALRAVVKQALKFVQRYRSLIPDIEDALDIDEEERAEEREIVDDHERALRAALEDDHG